MHSLQWIEWKTRDWSAPHPNQLGLYHYTPSLNRVQPNVTKKSIWGWQTFPLAFKRTWIINNNTLSEIVVWFQHAVATLWQTSRAVGYVRTALHFNPIVPGKSNFAPILLVAGLQHRRRVVGQSLLLLACRVSWCFCGPTNLQQGTRFASRYRQHRSFGRSLRTMCRTSLNLYIDAIECD